jgi:hypothetical protein
VCVTQCLNYESRLRLSCPFLKSTFSENPITAPRRPPTLNLLALPFPLQPYFCLSLVPVVFIPRPSHRLFSFHLQPLRASKCDANKERQNFGCDWIRIAPLEFTKTQHPSSSKQILFKVSWLQFFKNKLFLWEVSGNTFGPPPIPPVTNMKEPWRRVLQNQAPVTRPVSLSSNICDAKQRYKVTMLRNRWCLYKHHHHHHHTYTHPHAYIHTPPPHTDTYTIYMHTHIHAYYTHTYTHSTTHIHIPTCIHTHTHHHYHHHHHTYTHTHMHTRTTTTTHRIRKATKTGIYTPFTHRHTRTLPPPTHGHTYYTCIHTHTYIHTLHTHILHTYTRTRTLPHNTHKHTDFIVPVKKRPTPTT